MITRRQASGGILASAALAAAPTVVVAQEPKPFDLPPPRSEGGQPLTTALKLRRSTREYSNRPLPVQVLSDLLWAAFGVNRADSGIPPRLKICGGATTGKRVRRTPIRCSMKRISQSWLIVSRACWSQIPPGPLPRYSSSTLASIATTQGRLVPIVRRTTYRSLP